MMTGTPLASAQSHVRTTVLGSKFASPSLPGEGLCWVESGRSGVASGWTGVAAKAVIQF